VATYMAAILSDAGYHVLGPLHSSTDGIEAISTFRPDAALLDVRLARGTSLLLAEELERQNIPFALVSGATRRMIAARYRNRPFLAKPFGTGELLETVGALVHSGARSSCKSACRGLPYDGSDLQ